MFWVMIFAVACSTWSPTACPCVSFTCLKWSISHSSRPRAPGYLARCQRVPGLALEMAAVVQASQAVQRRHLEQLAFGNHDGAPVMARQAADNANAMQMWIQLTSAGPASQTGPACPGDCTAPTAPGSRPAAPAQTAPRSGPHWPPTMAGTNSSR